MAPFSYFNYDQKKNTILKRAKLLGKVQDKNCLDVVCNSNLVFHCHRGDF